MKIAIAQSDYKVGDFDGNKAKIISAIERAKNNGVDLVVFAEYAICGTPACDFLRMTSFLTACEDALTDIADVCDGISVLVGLPLVQNGKTMSAAAFVQNGQVLNYITKRNVTLAEERPYVNRGLGSDYVTVGGRKIAVALGQDMFDDDEYFANADVVVGMCADPFFRRRITWRYDKLRKRAFTKSKNIVFVNQVGAASEVVYYGSSAVFNAKGEAIALLADFEEDYAELDIDAENEALEVPERNDKTTNHFKAIRLGLKDFFAKNGYTKAALVLTGGVDSAVVAAMLVEALGRRNVLALLLPTGFSKFHKYENAKLVASTLKIAHFDVDIDDAFSRLKKKASEYIDVTEEAGEALQSRIAGSVLMGVYDCMGAVPVNTSNKTEIAIGDVTMYGNQVGFLSVLGDLYKHDVYALARYLNREREMIPNEIMARIPSAELKPEIFGKPKQLPSYEVLDAILYRLLEEGQSMEEITNAGFDSEVVGDVLDVLASSRMCRYQFCPILRLSSHPFNKAGNLQPITADYGFAK